MASGTSSIPRRLRRAVSSRRLEPVLQQREIAGLRLEDEIEQVADERHGADQRVERDVAEHVQLDGRGSAQAPRHVQGVDRDHRAGHVAEAGHQPEQRVDAEAPARAGNAEGLVEQPRDRPQPFQIAPAAGFAFAVFARALVHRRLTTLGERAAPGSRFPAPG